MMSKVVIALLVALVARDAAAQCNCTTMFPVNGTDGNCSANISNGSTCTSGCASGYNVVTAQVNNCTAGVCATITNGTCALAPTAAPTAAPTPAPTPAPCDCTKLFPVGGSAGTCNTTQASGTTCSPACAAGQTTITSGVNTCNNGTCVATTNETCGIPITFVITGTNSQNFGVLNGINVCTGGNKTCVQSYVMNYTVNSMASTATSFSGTTSFNQGSLVNSSSYPASACVDPSSNQLTAFPASQGSTAFTATVASYAGMSPMPSLITVGSGNPYVAAIGAFSSGATPTYMELGDYMADGVTYAAGVNLTTGSAATGTSNMAMILGCVPVNSTTTIVNISGVNVPVPTNNTMSKASYMAAGSVVSTGCIIAGQTWTAGATTGFLGSCVAPTPAPTTPAPAPAKPVVTTTVVKQAVSFSTTFSIPTTGMLAAGLTQATDTNQNFTAAYAAYGAACGAGSWSTPNYVFTATPGMTLTAASSRRTSAAFTLTITTCTSNCVSGTTYASAAALQSVTAATSNTATLAAAIATQATTNAIPGATNITAPVVSTPAVTTTTTGDSGKTAVVAVTAFATAVIAMMM